MSETGAWHIHAVDLPSGSEPVDWWIVDGRLTRTPVGGATTLPGTYVAPGLVDAHAHLTMDLHGFGLPAGDALIAANAAAHLAVGVTAVRDAGTIPGFDLDADVGGLAVISCGPLFAPEGRAYPGICTAVAPGELAGAVAARVAGGATWVKVIADFPGPDWNWFAANPMYPVEEIAEAVAVAHAGGARVAAHVSSPFVADLIDAGVDSIEHGPLMTPALVDAMAERGTAWVPTLSTVVAKHLDPLTGPGSPIAGYLTGAVYPNLAASLARAVARGVPILTGSDERPEGSVALEMAQLRRFGLSGDQALAAATTWARDYLGLPGLEAGAVADVVVFDADPRVDPGVQPRRVADEVTIGTA